MYDVPLSTRTTALLDGAFATVVVTEIVLVPTNTASRRTVQRVGEFTGNVGIAVVSLTAAYSGSTSPIKKVPSMSSVGSDERWSENAMKFGSVGLSLKRLYRRLRPDDAPVLLTSASTVERDVKPSPRMPLVPYERAGFTAEDTSK